MLTKANKNPLQPSHNSVRKWEFKSHELVNVIKFCFSQYFIIKTWTQTKGYPTANTPFSFSPFLPPRCDVGFAFRAEQLPYSLPARVIYVDKFFNAFFVFYFGLRVSALRGKGELQTNYLGAAGVFSPFFCGYFLPLGCGSPQHFCSIPQPTC